MRLMHRESSTAGEPRYDTGTLRKVAVLAARLQSQKQETLTAREIETIGAEAGLEPAFVQQALAQLAHEKPRAERGSTRTPAPWSLVTAFTLTTLWGILFYLGMHGHILTAGAIFGLITPLPLAALLGFLLGSRKVGFFAGIGLVLTLALALLAVLATMPAPPQAVEMIAPVVIYLLIGGALAGPVAWQAGKVGEDYRSLPGTRQPVSRLELLNQLFALQRQLEGQKQHRAFLSVDVVGSSEMKRAAPEQAVEHSFGQYRAWVEQVVHAHGGEMQSAAGDVVMALFPADAGALRAARQLQEELPLFNQAQNRLPQPLRIRCGISAGEVGIEEGTPLGHLQSPVIDRAAALQKRAAPGDIAVSGEAAAAALIELGNLAPLPEPVAGEPAFSWRAGQSEKSPLRP